MPKKYKRATKVTRRPRFSDDDVEHLQEVFKRTAEATADYHETLDQFSAPAKARTRSARKTMPRAA
jgi:hypothetical protein